MKASEMPYIAQSEVGKCRYRQFFPTFKILILFMTTACQGICRIISVQSRAAPVEQIRQLAALLCDIYKVLFKEHNP